MVFVSKIAVCSWMSNVVVPSKAGNLDAWEVDLVVVGIPKDRLLDLEALLLLLGLGAFKVASVVDLLHVVTAVDSEAASAVVIEEALEVDEEALDSNPEVTSAEEVGMVEGMVMAQHHPLMLLQVQVVVEAVLAAHPPVVQPTALQGRTAVPVGMVPHVVAHMTTDPLTAAAAMVEVGLAVIAAQEASLAVIVNPCDPEREVTGTGIGTEAEDETTTMVAGRGITMAMATTTHAANGDTSRFCGIIGLLGGFSRFQHCFPSLPW